MPFAVPRGTLSNGDYAVVGFAMNPITENVVVALSCHRTSA